MHLWKLTAVILILALLSSPASSSNQPMNYEGIIRLRGSRHRNQGRVELNINGSWGTVCSNGWGIEEASVVCRMLGLPTATQSVREAAFTAGIGAIWLSGLECTGTEDSLFNCSYAALKNTGCSHDNDAGVVCGPPRDDVFLIDGASRNQGRVEVFINGTFGSILSDYWDIADAQVVCRMLGLPPATHALQESLFGSKDTGKIMMENVRCAGNESSLFQCSYNDRIDEGWYLNYQAGVVCGKLSVKVQLVGGKSANEGQVEIAIGPVHGPRRVKWTLLCDEDRWTIEDARVVCRMLGYGDASFAVSGSLFNDGSGMYVLVKNFECYGNETNIGDCKYYNIIKTHNLCPLVGVICGPSNITVPMRLIGGPTPNSGRVELNVGGAWGTVCETGWTLTNAKVVCSLLGLPQATSVTAGSIFGEGSGPIFLDGVKCNGNESSLLECSHGGIGYTNCNHKQEAGVFCGNTQVDIRLTGQGSTANQGRVELTIGGVNGTVCNIGWDVRDAQVLCRMLGRGSTGFPVRNVAFGQGSGAVLLRNVQCLGNETDIMACRHDEIGYAKGCSHSTDAGVICGDTPVRLTGGTGWNTGRPEIQIDGVWGRIIGFYSEHAARVLCRQMGIPGFAYRPLIWNFYKRQSGNTAALILNHGCLGNSRNATSILECEFDYIRTNGGRDTMITCGPASANINISNWTASQWNSSDSRPENALDNDERTCYISKKQVAPSFIVELSKEAFVHTVSVIHHAGIGNKSSLTIYVKSSDDSIMCSLGSRFATEGGETYVCEPPFKGRSVIVTLGSAAQTLVLCNIEIFAFDNFEEAKGLLHERWELKYIDRSKGALFRFNDHLTNNQPLSVVISQDFLYRERVSGSLPVPVRVSGYLQFEGWEAGNYQFFVSCDDECELWFSRVTEKGLSSDSTSVNYIIKAQRKTPFGVYDRYPEQKSEVQNINPCLVYYVEGYLIRTQDSFMTIRVKSTQEDEVLRELPRSTAFWRNPGSRRLDFILQNKTDGVVEAKLGSLVSLWATYKYCCSGVYCPNCSLWLQLQIEDKRMSISSHVLMNCETQIFQTTFNPPSSFESGDYTIKILYGFNATFPSYQRNVGIMRISVSTVMECDFNEGLCPGWSIETKKNSSSWHLEGNSGNYGPSIQMNDTGSSLLKAPLPWKPGYSSIKLCLTFQYMLPAEVPSDSLSNLAVGSRSPSRWKQVWSVRGYHGNKWKQAAVQFSQEKNLQIIFEGNASASVASLSIGIRLIKITTTSCSTQPSRARPDHRCKKDQFMCDNEECVKKALRCNGLRDGCFDGSDERGCLCLSHQFQCFSGECCDVSKVCDGNRDCSDGFDEKNCGLPCSDITCPDGKCRSAVCPNQADSQCSNMSKCDCAVSNLECEAGLTNSSRTQACSSAAIQNCAFDESLCGMESRHWKRTVALYSPIFEQIPIDHTFHTPKGAYLFLWQEDAVAKKGHLFSKPSPPSTPLCLQFWYQIHGSAKINIYTSTVTNVHTRKVLSLSAGTQKKWLFAQTVVSQPSFEFKAVIEGVTRTDGDAIALDDLNLILENCSTTITKVNPSCSFNNSKCSWTGHEDWRIPQKTVNPYLYLAGGKPEERTIRSPVFNPHVDRWRCISFWFWSTHQFYRRSIEVRLTKEDGSIIKTLWAYRATVQDGVYVQLPLLHIDDNVRVAITAQKSQSQPWIKFNNFLFSKEECEVIAPISECHEYSVLDSIERRVTSPGGSSCDDALNLFTWYRIAGKAGNQIPEKVVPSNRCGTKNQVYLDASHPDTPFARAALRSCIRDEFTDCFASGHIFVRNCGSYFVYQHLATSYTFCPAKHCTTYKEITPVYSSTKEWAAWKTKNSSFEWRVLDKVELKKLSQSYLKSHDLTQTESGAIELSIFNKTDVLMSIMGSERQATEMTLCLWVKMSKTMFNVKYSWPNATGFRVVLSEDNIIIMFSNSTRTVDQRFLAQTWYHVCITWQSSWGVWHVFVDGSVIGCGQGLGDLLEIKEMGVLTVTVASQNTNNQNSNSSLTITDLNIWTHALSGETIANMSFGCDRNQGNLLWWKDLAALFAKNKGVISRPVTCLGESGPVLALHSNKTSRDKSGIVESPRYQRSHDINGKCLNFRYKIFGDKSNTLSLFQTIEYNGSSEQKIWIDQAKNTNKWQTGKVWIETAFSYKIRIEGSINNSGFIAIAGLHMSSESCSLTPSPPLDTSYPACTMKLSNKSGEIVSPNYPGSYPAGLKCAWTIEAIEGEVIRLTFLAFDLGEDDSECTADRLELVDGSNGQQSFVGVFCGSIYPQTVMSTTNRLQVTLTAAGQQTFRGGFRLRYQAIPDEKSNCIRDCPPECQCYQSSTGIVVRAVNLFAIPRRLPFETAFLMLAGNSVMELKGSNFARLAQLKYIDLSWNNLLRIDARAFHYSRHLIVLNLNRNYIRTLDTGIFSALTRLETLHLGQMALSEFPNVFQALRSLKILNLRGNFIKRLRNSALDRNTDLKQIYLHNNQIDLVEDGFFQRQTKLRVLYLSDNKITGLTKSTFLGLSSLEILHLENNPIKEKNVQQDVFSVLPNLRYLKLDSFILCCYARRDLPDLTCDAPVNKFSSCNDLLKYPTLQVCIWIMGLFALLGNLYVIVYWNFFAPVEKGSRGQKARVQSFLLTNLALADFCMGLYLVVIATQGELWRGNYFEHDVEWRNGITCHMAGALVTLASEVSVMILVTITADRLNCIVFHIRAQPLRLPAARIICVLIWILSCLIAFLPLSPIPYFYDDTQGIPFYGSSAVCLPLQLSNMRQQGWKYSVGVFMVFNGVAFLFILAAYTAILVKVRISSQAVRSTMKKDTSLAIRVTLIILTDFCCWMPVIIIGIIALLGEFPDSTGSAHAWIAVFVLPINSSINPILYTFSNPKARTALWKCCVEWKKKGRGNRDIGVVNRAHTGCPDTKQTGLSEGAFTPVATTSPSPLLKVTEMESAI